MMQHVLLMNTFDSAIKQPFYSYFPTLQLQFIATEHYVSKQNQVQCEKTL